MFPTIHQSTSRDNITTLQSVHKALPPQFTGPTGQVYTLHCQLSVVNTVQDLMYPAVYRSALGFDITIGPGLG